MITKSAIRKILDDNIDVDAEGMVDGKVEASESIVAVLALEVMGVNDQCDRAIQDCEARCADLRKKHDDLAAELCELRMARKGDHAMLASQRAQLKANIYLAMGKTDSARAVLQQALAAQPQNFRLKAKLDSIR